MEPLIQTVNNINESQTLEGRYTDFQKKYFDLLEINKRLKDKNNLLIENNVIKEKKIKSNFALSEMNKSEEELQSNESWAKLIFEHTTNSMFLLALEENNDYVFFKVNPAFCAMLGLESTQIIGKSIYEVFQDGPSKLIAGYFNPILKEKKTLLFENEINGPGGAIYCETRLTPIFNIEGTPYLLTGISKNITETKKAAKKALVNGKRKKAAQNLSGFGDWEYDCKTGEFSWSDQLYLLFARDPKNGPVTLEEMISFYKDENAILLKKSIHAAIKTGDEFEIDLYLQHPNQKQVYHYSACQTIRDKKGEVSKVFGIILDITTRKIAEIKWKIERNNMNNLIDNLPDMVYIKDAEGRKIRTNRADVKICGVDSYKEILGKTDLEIYPGKLGKDRYEQDMKVIRTGKPILNYEESFKDKDGSEIWFLTSKVPLLNEEGQVNGLIGVGRVITDLKKSQEELKISNERYLYAANATSDAIWDWDIINDHLYWGEGYEKIFGYKVSGKVENYIQSFDNLHSEDREVVFSDIDKAIAGKDSNWSSEYRYKKANGEYAFVIDKAIIIRNEEGKAIRMIGAMQDITDSKMANKALVESENYLRAIFESEPECVKLLDRFGNLENMNPAGLKMIEAENLDEVKGAPVINLIDEPFRKAFKRLHQDVFKGIPGYLEFKLTGLKGKILWMDTRVVPLKDASGKIVSSLGITRDISEKKQAEEALKKTNEQLKKLSRHLHLIREDERKFLAREVHDELGQLASVIKMDIDWLHLRLKGLEENQQNRILHASSTTEILINSIRKIALSLRPVMIDELGLTASLEWQCKEFASVNGIPCEFENYYVEETLSKEVKVELFRICQESLTNIMRHAKATRVTVRLQHQLKGVYLYVVDNGIGFEKNQKKDSFGLSGMLERVLSVKGKLTIDSKNGKGTTICAFIPVKKQKK